MAWSDMFTPYEKRIEELENENERLEDLINRQKAEIERLSKFVSEERCYEIAREMIPHFVKQARDEAINEFTERLIELYTDEHITDEMRCSVGIIKQNIYDVKEIMVGEQ